MKIEIIKATLLGDAWIQKFKHCKNGYSFSYSQSNREYAIWKAQLINLPYKIYERNRFDKRTNKTYYSCQIIFKLHKNIKKELYDIFYNSVKTVNLNILNSLTDQSVAVWYLDDGNVYYNGNTCHITLSVNGFIFEERNLIIDWFKEKYDLNFKHSQKAIRLTSKTECLKFMNIVEKYIPNCMEYKKLSKAINIYKLKKNDK
jgi:hypothetical protein